MLRLCVYQVAECSAMASVQLSQFNHDTASIDTFVKQCGNAALTAASLLTLKSVRQSACCTSRKYSCTHTMLHPVAHTMPPVTITTSDTLSLFPSLTISPPSRP